LVIPEGGDKLVALVFPDYDALKSNNISDEQFNSILEKIKHEVNARIPEYMAVSKYRIHPEEFVKTPKKSIKRFLYTKK
jgi:long-chain acyl-CoA synthetase